MPGKEWEKEREDKRESTRGGSMKRNRLTISFVLLVWLLAGLSCHLGPATPEPPTEEGVTVEAPTSFMLPSGVLIDTMDDTGITFYNTAGLVITELTTPGLENASPSEIHLAGTVSGPIMTPLVFHAWDPQSRIKKNINDAISLVANTPDFYAMSGAPGQSVMVYSSVSYNPGYTGITSNLYFGTVDALSGGGGLVYSEPSSESFAAYPLAVNAEGNAPLGFWYSRQMYGIGDVIFAPQKGLFYYDLASNSVAPVLDETRTPLAISLDHQWFAYNARQGDESVNILNISTSAHAAFSLLPTSNSGAGNATFSPDSLQVAWMEASGHPMTDPPDFHSVVRVARTDGALVRDVTDANFGAALAASVTWVEPVAWLDNSTLLVQVRGANWTDAWVIKLDVNTGGISLFTAGGFMGLYYP
jgi:hypothetical protein